jgi:hypothetical protein
MSNELGAAVGATLGGGGDTVVRQHSAPPGTPCANCATPLQGPWCYACGQSGEDFHRSVVRLCGEVLESLFHVDGRFWRTVPNLLFNPGKLTRAFLDGHRAPQIPPLRLFLVVLLAIFLVGGLTGKSKLVNINISTSSDQGGKVTTQVSGPKTLDQLTPAERASLSKELSKVKVNLGRGDDPAAADWLKDRVQRALADPQKFYLVLEQWSERFAFLMLPITALLLSLAFIFQRRFYLFDHTIFSLHSLSAVGLMITGAIALGPLIGHWSDLLIVPAPIHLYFHMRGVYRTSILGTLIRMLFLFCGATTAAALLFLGLIAVGLNGMGG